MTGYEELTNAENVEFSENPESYILRAGDVSVYFRKSLPQQDKLRITRALCDAITQMGLAVVSEGIETIQPVEQARTFVNALDRTDPWVPRERDSFCPDDPREEL